MSDGVIIFVIVATWIIIIGCVGVLELALNNLNRTISDAISDNEEPKNEKEK